MQLMSVLMVHLYMYDTKICASHLCIMHEANYCCLCHACMHDDVIICTQVCMHGHCQRQSIDSLILNNQLMHAKKHA